MIFFRKIYWVVRDFFNFLFLWLRWTWINRENYTKPGSVFDCEHVSVGKFSYGTLNVVDAGGDSKLLIGSYCSVAQNVWFLLNAEHEYRHPLSYPLIRNVLGGRAEAISNGDIIVEDDVWIGHGACILSGVTLGQGSIVAAGAVVTRDVEPYAIVAGIPARVIRMRFSKNIVDLLMQVDITSIDKKMVAENQEFFESRLDSLPMESIAEYLSRMKKKPQ